MKGGKHMIPHTFNTQTPTLTYSTVFTFHTTLKKKPLRKQKYSRKLFLYHFSRPSLKMVNNRSSPTPCLLIYGCNSNQYSSNSHTQTTLPTQKIKKKTKILNLM